MSDADQADRPVSIAVFEKQRTNCAICRKYNIIKRVKARIYIGEDLDVDSRPRSYKWLLKNPPELNPRIYHIATCKVCEWAADKLLFGGFSGDEGIAPKKFITEIRAAGKLDQHKKVLAVLKRNLSCDPEHSLNYIEAVKLHLLALYNQLMVPDILSREPYYAGKFALRTAWLFRDIQQDQKLTRLWGEQLETLLIELGAFWEDAPETEQDLNDLAIAYYKASLTQSRMLHTHRDEMECMLLISRMLMQQLRIPEAKEYLSLSQKRIKVFEQELKQLRHQASESDEPCQRVADAAANVRRMQRSFDVVMNLFEDQQHKWEQKQIESARMLIAKNSEMAALELRELLVKNDIAAPIANKLVPKSKEKKGLLNSLIGSGKEG